MTEQEMITRREAVRRVTAILGGVALVGSDFLITGCRPEVSPDKPFDANEIAYLDEIAETIIPRTSTPGAKDVKTGAFMAMMVHDTYDAKQRKIFREGMDKINDATKKKYNVGFMQATPQQRLAVLTEIDRDQKVYQDALKEDNRRKSMQYLSDQRQEQAPGANVGAATAVTEDKPTHYFRMMKELALLGYFTSEPGMTQAQRYIESPGRYDPCVPYTPGERAWAPHA